MKNLPMKKKKNIIFSKDFIVKVRALYLLQKNLKRVIKKRARMLFFYNVINNN